ncbi:hypothetical protein HFO91_22495 [Rhizobium leguminosarum]|uniref:hypothetical protein n=1 Tax=Rhizobium leguminosarum TaxID=384 RepID=UPI001C93F134|nr:hypothetical protein [Rhizobium leguminosarum]MBY5452387.1 hypothetical protein [Rhizobium leguminosarum]
MRIAVLGWGSLIWKPEKLAVKLPFEPGGPPLPIEFSRISKDGRLTLVIDEQCGTPCPALYAVSTLEDLADARESLRVREGMTHVNGVGFVDLKSEEVSARARERHPGTVPGIADWGRRMDFDAVIWTALAPNFGEVTKRTYSTEEAIAYLDTLSAEKFTVAAEYIRKAPSPVETPVRTAFSKRWPA